MSQPTPGDVHVNAPLTNISVAFVQKAEHFIADKVFPVVSVAKQSDLYYEFDRNDFMRDEAKDRADGTESAGSGFRLSTTTYFASVKALHKDVGDQLRANADSVLQLDTAATNWLTQKMLISREKQWGSAFFTTGVWGTDVVGASSASAGYVKFWNQSGSTPKADVDAGCIAILQNTGYLPNTLVLGYGVFKILQNHAEIRDQFKYTSAESINESMLARFFDLERVLVSKATNATNKEGATGAYSLIAGKNALLCYTPSAPSLMEAAAGYVFAWSGLVGSANGMRIKKFRMDHLNADRIEAEHSYDMKKVGSALGYFFSAVIE